MQTPTIKPYDFCSKISFNEAFDEIVHLLPFVTSFLVQPVHVDLDAENIHDESRFVPEEQANAFSLYMMIDMEQAEKNGIECVPLEWFADLDSMQAATDLGKFLGWFLHYSKIRTGGLRNRPFIAIEKELQIYEVVYNVPEHRYLTNQLTDGKVVFDYIPLSVIEHLDTVNSCCLEIFTAVDTTGSKPLGHLTKPLKRLIKTINSMQ